MCVIKPKGEIKTPELVSEEGTMVLYLPRKKFERLFPEASGRKVILVYQDNRRIIAAVEFPEQRNVRIKQFAPAVFWGDVKALTRWV